MSIRNVWLVILGGISIIAIAIILTRVALKPGEIPPKPDTSVIIADKNIVPDLAPPSIEMRLVPVRQAPVPSADTKETQLKDKEPNPNHQAQAKNIGEIKDELAGILLSQPDNDSINRFFDTLNTLPGKISLTLIFEIFTAPEISRNQQLFNKIGQRIMTTTIEILEKESGNLAELLKDLPLEASIDLITDTLNLTQPPLSDNLREKLGQELTRMLAWAWDKPISQEQKKTVLRKVSQSRYTPKLLAKDYPTSNLIGLFHQEPDIEIKKELLGILARGINQNQAIGDFVRSLVVMPESDENIKTYAILGVLPYAKDAKNIGLLISIIQNADFNSDLRATAISTLPQVKKSNPEVFAQYYVQVSATLWEIMNLSDRPNITEAQTRLVCNTATTLAAVENDVFLNRLLKLIETVDDSGNEAAMDLRHWSIALFKHYPDSPVVINKLLEIAGNEKETEKTRCLAITTLGNISLDNTDNTKQLLDSIGQNPSLSLKIKQTISETLKYLERTLDQRRSLESK